MKHLASTIPLVTLAALLLAAPCLGGPVYSVDLSSADPDTILTVESIQGLLNRTADQPDQPAIYVIRSPEDPYWLTQYTRDPEPISPQDLIAKFKDRAAGQILYDPERPFTAHIALSAAGPLDAVVTSADLGLDTILDCRREWKTPVDAYRWAIGNLLRRCNHEALGVLDETGAGPRDYFVKERIFVLSLDPNDPDARALIEQTFRRMPTGVMVIGPPALQEGPWAALIQRDGHSLVPCSPLANLSVHSAFGPSVPLAQPVRYLPPGDKTVVAFAYLGGEDVAFAFRRMAELWMEPGRGSVPIGWTLSPALLDLAPAVLQRYYAEATLSGSDQFIMAPNGADALPLTGNRYLSEVLHRTRDYAERADLTVMAVSDPGADVSSAMDRCVREGGIHGLLPLSGTMARSALYGEAPAVAEAVRATTPQETLDAIRGAAQAAKYIFVAVPPQALSPVEIGSIASRLGDDFEVAGPLDLIAAARQGAVLAAATPTEESALEVGDVTLSPEHPAPTDQVTVTAHVSGGQAEAGRLIFTVDGSPARWAARATALGDGTLVGLLPPLLHGGTVTLRVQAIAAGGVSLSQPVLLGLRAPDADADGLSDAEEAFLRSDPADPDTDRDGLRDGNDPDPLRTTLAAASYMPPILPPGDGHVLDADEGSSLTPAGRQVTGDARFTYRIPLDAVPEGTQAVLTAIVSGQPALAVSSDNQAFAEVAVPEAAPAALVPVRWPIPAEYLAAGTLYLRFAAGADTPQTATLHSVGLGSSPDAPSIILHGLEPGHPAPGLRSAAVATAYDPDGVKSVDLLYRTGEGVIVARPMQERGATQVFAADLPELASGNRITIQVRAADKQGHTAISAPMAFPVGITRDETISLVAGRDFEGQMRPWPAGGAGWRWGTAGQSDRASAILLGGRYALRLLADPRGAGLQVQVDGQPVGEPLALDASDGWQHIGTLSLPAGKHQFGVMCVPGGPKDALRGYGQLIVTADPGTLPRSGPIVDYFNTISILSPAPDSTVTRRVTIRATATGNVIRADCYVDGTLIGHERLPPYEFRWDTRDSRRGEHTIEVRAINAANEPMLSTQIHVTVTR